MSYIRDKIEKVSEDSRVVNPPAGLGWLVRTESVVQEELKNPWFVSLSGMSESEGQALLQKDAVKSGLSFLARSPDVGKGEQIYINPKTFEEVYGAEWGKIGNLNPDDKLIKTGELLYTGGQHQAPTVVGIYSVNSPITPGYESAGGRENNRPVPQEESVTEDSGNFKSNLPDDIEPETGELKTSEYTGVGAMGGNTLVGTMLIPDTDLSLMVKRLDINSFDFGGVTVPGFGGGSFKF